ncbi:MAG: transporter substrate-binding domain-containing protein, partial [Clostridia bacterium]|nr:transporter substrate-binding domain-containing protein [Clostridia bacterium]
MRVAVCGKSKPLVFLDADGTPSGMYIDIMDELARIGGLDIEYVVFDRKKQAIESLERGEVDAVLGTLESDQTGNPLLASTSEIYSASMCLVAEKGKSDYILRHALTYGYSTAYEVGTSSFVRISQIRPSPILIMSNQDSLYDALRSGEADMVIAVRDCIQYRIREAGLSDAYTTAINYLSSVSYSILLKRSDELRLNTLNTCISSLRSGTEYARIVDKWIIDADLEDAQLRIRNLTYIMAIVFGAALIIVSAFLFFNKRLKQVVAEKTSELKEKVDDLENAYVLRNKLMEHAYAANLVVRQDGSILLMNDVARQMVELPSDREDIPTIEELPVIGELWKKASQAMTQPQLLAVRDGKGVRRTYRYQCHRTSVPDEFVLIVEDVTSEERKKTEILEENKSQALNRIIAGIAHEIKNPLTTIRNYAVLADEEGSDPEFMASFH